MISWQIRPKAIFTVSIQRTCKDWNIYTVYDFNDYIKQLATAEQYDRFISCLDKAVVYKAHTPKSYYAAIGNALPIKSYCGLTIFVPQESLPKMLEWYKQRVGWYKAVYE